MYPYPSYISDLVSGMRDRRFVVHEEYDAKSFGDVVVVSILEDFIVRIVGDRGQWRIEIKNPRQGDGRTPVNCVCLCLENKSARSGVARGSGDWQSGQAESARTSVEWLTANLDEVAQLFSRRSFADRIGRFQESEQRPTSKEWNR